MTRTLSIAIKENTYQELKQLVGTGKISSFVNNAVEKELTEKKQELIAAYQSAAQSKDLQKEAKI
jgi:hypothetical protein